MFVAPGQSIQNAVNANLGGTAFCLGAGVHSVLSPITPKTGNSFTGEFGAVLDGTGMTFPAEKFGLINAHNQDIDNVTIRNLIIQDSPRKGIHAYAHASDGWVVDHNEIRNNHTGIQAANSQVVSSNYIHHNVGTGSLAAERGGGYSAYQAHDILFVNNEIAFNGSEQKVVNTVRVTFRGNYVHHAKTAGIWYDWANTGAVIEGNVVEDNGRGGVEFEGNTGGVIRNNSFARNADYDLFLTQSSAVEVHSNIFTVSDRGVALFRDQAVSGVDVRDNLIRDNTFTVVSGTAAQFSCINATTEVCMSYVTDKNNRFERNDYDVPDPKGAWWFVVTGTPTWAQWQALGFDVAGSVK